MTNADHQQVANRGAGWRFAGFRRRCDRYFGEVQTCSGIICTGEPVFNTGVPRFPGLMKTAASARRATVTVCEGCARAPYQVEEEKAA